MKAHGSFGVLSRVAHGVFSNDGKTLAERAFQFTVNAVLGTFISVFVIRTFFPGFMGHGAAAASAASSQATQEGLGCGCRREEYA